MKPLGLLKTPRLSASASTGFLVLRLVAGLAFMHHGWDKIQDPTGWAGPDSAIPGFFLALAAISEFGGGLAWMLGLLTRLASFGLTCTMAVAVHFHAIHRGDPFASTGQGPVYEPAAVYFCIAIVFLLAGPGRFSLDRLIFGEKTE